MHLTMCEYGMYIPPQMFHHAYQALNMHVHNISTMIFEIKNLAMIMFSHQKLLQYM